MWFMALDHFQGKHLYYLLVFLWGGSAGSVSASMYRKTTKADGADEYRKHMAYTSGPIINHNIMMTTKKHNILYFLI